MCNVTKLHPGNTGPSACATCICRRLHPCLAGRAWRAWRRPAPSNALAARHAAAGSAQIVKGLPATWPPPPSVTATRCAPASAQPRRRRHARPPAASAAGTRRLAPEGPARRGRAGHGRGACSGGQVGRRRCGARLCPARESPRRGQPLCACSMRQLMPNYFGRVGLAFGQGTRQLVPDWPAWRGWGHLQDTRCAGFMPHHTFGTCRCVLGFEEQPQ